MALGVPDDTYPKTFTLFGFQIFWLWVYLMNVIPGTRRAH